MQRERSTGPKEIDDAVDWAQPTCFMFRLVELLEAIFDLNYKIEEGNHSGS
ncbi:MAG: hypothetical protein PVJ05_11355 [Candidatus Thorarchaeota archaeon]|jgi:hypothetical protein